MTLQVPGRHLTLRPLFSDGSEKKSPIFSLFNFFLVGRTEATTRSSSGVSRNRGAWALLDKLCEAGELSTMVGPITQAGDVGQEQGQGLQDGERGARPRGV